MSIISLVPRQSDHECQSSALVHLQAVMDRVKAGETQTVGIVEVTPDGATRIAHSKSENVNLLIAGCARLQHYLATYLYEKTRS